MRKKDRHELLSPIQPQLVLSLCARFLKKGTIVLEIAVIWNRSVKNSCRRDIITQVLHFSQSDLFSGLISDYRTSGAETNASVVKEGCSKVLRITNLYMKAYLATEGRKNIVGRPQFVLLFF